MSVRLSQGLALRLLSTCALAVWSASAVAAPVVQSGTATLVAGAGASETVDVVISSIDPAASILWFNYRGNSDAPGDGRVRGQITDATHIRFFRSNDSSLSNLVIQWYVVEFPFSVLVQRGTLATVNNTSTVTISTVDLTRSFVLVSGSAQASHQQYGSDDFFRARLTAADTLEIIHNTTGTQEVDWQVVEYEASVVQRGIGTLSSAQTQTSLAISSVNTGKSIVLLSWKTNADGTAENLLHARITDSTSLTVERSVAGSATVDFAWEVVEFLDETSVQSGRRLFGGADLDHTISLDAFDTSSSIASLTSAGGGWGGLHEFEFDDLIGPGMFTTELTAGNALTITRAVSNASPAKASWFVAQFGTTACTLAGECNDDNDCTTDTCDNGICTHIPGATGVVCGSGTDTECDSPDTCDDVGNCLSNFVVAGTPCGDPTITECDTADTCDGGGSCQPNYVTDGAACGDGTDDDCTDPDSCDGAGACTANHAIDSTPCDDGMFCTENTTCTSGSCGGGSAINCSDGLPCTLDSCNESTDVCAHAPDAQIDVIIEVEAINQAVQRDVTFVITDCDSGIAETRILPVDLSADGLGTIVLTGVSDQADWISATEGHTLRRLLALSFAACTGDADFVITDRLIAGDFFLRAAVKDNLVDVTDFAIIASVWNELVDVSEGSGADATADGVQGTADFTAIQINFFEIGDPQDGCPVAGGGQLGTVPTVYLTASELSPAMLWKADQNGDRSVDAHDIRLFAQRTGIKLSAEFERKLGERRRRFNDELEGFSRSLKNRGASER